MREHWSAMVAVAMRYAVVEDEAEDIAQEAFHAAWQRRDKLRDPKGTRAWLLRFVRNKGLHAVRARNRRRALEEQAWMEEITLAQGTSVLGAFRHTVLAALHQLPEIQAKIVRLMLDDMSDSDIASRLGIRKQTLWVYKHRAVKKLKSILARARGGGGKSLRHTVLVLDSPRPKAPLPPGRAVCS